MNDIASSDVSDSLAQTVCQKLFPNKLAERVVVLFPLTPALSLRERETRFAASGQTGALVLLEQRDDALPLLWGEGWGEGGRDAQPRKRKLLSAITLAGF